MQSQYLDVKGNPVKRTRDKFPYSYDPYVIYQRPEFKESDLTFYSDRVEHCYFTREEQDKALEKMGLKRYGGSWERFSWKNPSQVQEYLSILMNKPILVTAITEGANHATGYEYWIVYVQEVK